MLAQMGGAGMIRALINWSQAQMGLFPQAH